MTYDTNTLQAGTWVRPIEYTYLPAHVKADERWRFFNSETEMFYYTPVGIMPIAKKLVRKK